MILKTGILFVSRIRYPTVEKGKERVRVCLHAGNTVEEVRGLVGDIKSWLERAFLDVDRRWVVEDEAEALIAIEGQFKSEEKALARL
jgi:hypothetical protein